MHGKYWKRKLGKTGLQRTFLQSLRRMQQFPTFHSGDEVLTHVVGAGHGAADVDLREGLCLLFLTSVSEIHTASFRQPQRTQRTGHPKPHPDGWYPEKLSEDLAWYVGSWQHWVEIAPTVRHQQTPNHINQLQRAAEMRLQYFSVRFWKHVYESIKNTCGGPSKVKVWINT